LPIQFFPQRFNERAVGVSNHGLLAVLAKVRNSSTESAR
jgi:hypothetical protein